MTLLKLFHLSLKVSRHIDRLSLIFLTTHGFRFFEFSLELLHQVVLRVYLSAHCLIILLAFRAQLADCLAQNRVMLYTGVMVVWHYVVSMSHTLTVRLAHGEVNILMEGVAGLGDEVLLVGLRSMWHAAETLQIVFTLLNEQ